MANEACFDPFSPCALDCNENCNAWLSRDCGSTNGLLCATNAEVLDAYCAAGMFSLSYSFSFRTCDRPDCSCSSHDECSSHLPMCAVGEAAPNWWEHDHHQRNRRATTMSDDLHNLHSLLSSSRQRAHSKDVTLSSRSVSEVSKYFFCDLRELLTRSLYVNILLETFQYKWTRNVL